nr:zinc knuckle CX2CX4HX4C [Tanacetum cinerariifolium]
MEGHYTCNVRVEYKWKLPRCSSCKVFGHIHEECPKNTGAGEKKTVKKPSQTSRGVLVGPKMGLNLIKNIDLFPKSVLLVPMVIRRKVWNLLLSCGTTAIIEIIMKFEDLLTSGQAILVDKAGNPLKKVEFLGDNDNEDEVALFYNDMARSMAYERVGFNTQSLLEQWRDLYGNGDYDDDLYDDDMYEARELLVTQLIMYQTRYGKPLPIVVSASSSRLGGP